MSPYFTFYRRAEKIFEPNEQYKSASSHNKKKTPLYYDETLTQGHDQQDQQPSATYHGPGGPYAEDHDRPEDGKVKGWRESGYKIVTEVEYSDKGNFLRSIVPQSAIV